MALNILKIKEIMLKKGMNQTEIAKKSKIQKSTVSKILSGKTKKTNIKTIHNIAKALEVDPIEITKED